MFASEPQVTGCDDESLEALPQSPAVFVIRRHSNEPYLGRTAMLRRRLKRMMRIRGLKESAERVEFWLCASRLESSLVLYAQARQLLPDTYTEFLKLRFPPYVKLITSNLYPRTQVTSRLSGSGTFFGPFRSRGSAEIFDRQMLDLFQLRRCQEDLSPSAEHPGCIYGEMSMCLRPCQELVGVAEYATEAARVTEFLRTGGKTALQAAEASRERLSAEMEFEAAARQHKRVERIAEVVKSRDDLARDVELQSGVVVTAGHQPGTVLLWSVFSGWFSEPTAFGSIDGQTVSMDQRLRELIGKITPQRGSASDRQEHLALLARWYYSSWRDGAWIEFDSATRIPVRRIVTAVSRIVHQNSPAASE